MKIRQVILTDLELTKLVLEHVGANADLPAEWELRATDDKTFVFGVEEGK